MLGLFKKLQKERVIDGVEISKNKKQKKAVKQRWCCPPPKQEKRKKKRGKKNKKKVELEKPSEQVSKFEIFQRWWHTMPEFVRYMRGGCNQSNNTVASVSSVSIFAFVDKEGIVTENQKYIDEVCVLNQQDEKVIIDFSHVSQIEDESSVYQNEGNQKQFDENKK